MIKLGLISFISFLICLNSIHCTESNATNPTVIKSEQVLKQDSSTNQTNAKLHRVALKSTHSESIEQLLPIETISSIDSDLKSNQDESIDKIVKEKVAGEKKNNPLDKSFSLFVPLPIRSMNNDQPLPGLFNSQPRLRSFFDSMKDQPSPLSKFMSVFDDILGKTRSAINNRPKWRWAFNNDYDNNQQTKTDSTTSESYIKDDDEEQFKFQDIPELPSISDSLDGIHSSKSNSKVEESSYSLDSDTGKAMSVEREVSLFMSNGPDGKKEIIVKQKPPKITFHRIQNPFAIAFQKFGIQNKDMNDDNPMIQSADSNKNEQIPTITLQKHFVGTLDDFFKEISKSIDRSNLFAPSSGQIKASTKSTHQSDGWNFGSNNKNNDEEEDNFPIYVTMNGPLGSLFHRVNFNNLDSDSNLDVNHENDMMMINENKPHSSWSSCLISMLPLLYLFLVILLLYLIIWLFYTVPTYLVNENSRARVARPRSGDNMTSSEFLDYRQKISEKLCHFLKLNRNAKYNPFGADKQSMPSRQASVSNSSIGGSTLSFPPPYAEVLASDPESKNTESVVVVDADPSPKK